MFVIPVLRRLRKEYGELESSLTMHLDPKYKITNPGIVAHACNSTSGELEA